MPSSHESPAANNGFKKRLDINLFFCYIYCARILDNGKPPSMIIGGRAMKFGVRRKAGTQNRSEKLGASVTAGRIRVPMI